MSKYIVVSFNNDKILYSKATKQISIAYEVFKNLQSISDKVFIYGKQTRELLAMWHNSAYATSDKEAKNV